MRSFVVDTTNSPFSRLKPVPITSVKFNGGFWDQKIKRNWKNGIPKLFQLLEAHGVLNNFRRLYGKYNGPRKGFLFTDSDLYKWMEGAALTLQVHEIPEIGNLLEQAIETILLAQGEDGYLNTWLVDDRANQRWSNLDDAHELYCAGHLIQAAIAHYRIAKDRKFLDCALRFADYIDETFRVKKQPGSPGHPEIEMALVELYRVTRKKRYLDLAGYFLEQRGVVSRIEIRGHAVRACYFMAGAMDYYLETGLSTYLNAISSQWNDMILHKIYITGGVGGRYIGEAFGNSYELPNERAYAETCAAIGTIFWNWRMLQHNGEARYTDWLERTLYNGFLAGVSLSGDKYFYVNPLASTGLGEDDPWYGWARKEPYQRKSWYDCTCCPPNVQRLLAALPSYFYSTSDEGLWIHLFDENELNCQLQDGSHVSIIQETNYPWDGIINIRVSSDSDKPFTLFVRIPSWVSQVSATLNSFPVTNIEPGTYLQITQSWKNEHLKISMDMPVEKIVSNYRVSTNRGSVAIQRGPIVYCLEGIDHNDQDVRYLCLQSESKFDAQYRTELLDGVVTLTADGLKDNNSNKDSLYTPVLHKKTEAFDELKLSFIPYYAWANRGATSMVVWVPYAN